MVIVYEEIAKRDPPEVHTERGEKGTEKHSNSYQNQSFDFAGHLLLAFGVSTRHQGRNFIDNSVRVKRSRMKTHPHAHTHPHTHSFTHMAIISNGERLNISANIKAP